MYFRYYLTYRTCTPTIHVSKVVQHTSIRKEAKVISCRAAGNSDPAHY